MKYDARKLSTDEQALLRRLTAQQVLDGESPTEVTRRYGLGDRTIYKWVKTAKEKGLDALAPKPRPGRGKILTDFEADEVKRWVLSEVDPITDTKSVFISDISAFVLGSHWQA